MKPNIANRSVILSESFLDHVASGKCAYSDVRWHRWLASLVAGMWCPKACSSGWPKIDSWWWQQNYRTMKMRLCGIISPSSRCSFGSSESPCLFFSFIFLLSIPFYIRLLRFRFSFSFACSSVYIYGNCYSRRRFPLLSFFLPTSLMTGFVFRQVHTVNSRCEIAQNDYLILEATS